MPHPQLQQRTASPDPADNVGTVQPSKDMLHVSLPFCSQSLLLPAPPRQSLQTTSMATAVHEFLPKDSHQDLPAAMKLEGAQPMLWANADHIPLGSARQDDTLFGAPASFFHSGEMCGFPQNGLPYQDNYGLEYSMQYLASSYPRSQNSLRHTTLPNDISMLESYPPEVYQVKPPKHLDIVDLSDQEIDNQLIQLKMENNCRNYGASHVKMEDNRGYQSPFSDLTRASTPPDESFNYSQSIHTEGDGMIDKELPYAQLIYQALMGAPKRTMVLRDIYQWFKDHTDKANYSETKGWQNSIRHNLSMNGAFEKVDQPGEEARKGFMWRLTKDAIRDGVKSTTRYRSRQPAKRGYRTQQPQPQRQASGSKGGQAARRSARMRRSNRANDKHRSDPRISRSVPSGFDLTFGGGEVPTPPTVGMYSDNEIDECHDTKYEDYRSPLMGPHLELFPSVRVYPAHPMSHEMPTNDPHFMLDQGPTQRLFTNSPSPSADEPRTPESPGGWNENIILNAPYVFDELAYRAYAG